MHEIVAFFYMAFYRENIALPWKNETAPGPLRGYAIKNAQCWKVLRRREVCNELKVLWAFVEYKQPMNNTVCRVLVVTNITTGQKW